mgnify:CR=1 FL=1
MPKPIKSYLIENNSHRIIEFKSERSLKKWVKENGLVIRHSPLTEHFFYTEEYTVLPTEWRD